MTDDDRAALHAVADAAGLDVSDDQVATLTSYAGWLESEAMTGGGLGPAEGPRIWARHVVDAAAYAAVIGPHTADFLDVGTGVGLPGLVLATLWPDAHGLLIDRSRRRVELARRASRVCAISNVEIRQAGHQDLLGTWPLVVSRATLPIEHAADELSPLIAPGGVGVVGVRRGSERPELSVAAGRGSELVTIPEVILDPPAWFLKIQPRG